MKLIAARRRCDGEMFGSPRTHVHRFAACDVATAAAGALSSTAISARGRTKRKEILLNSYKRWVRRVSERRWGGVWGGAAPRRRGTRERVFHSGDVPGVWSSGPVVDHVDSVASWALKATGKR